MNINNNSPAEKILRVTALVASIMALVELALSQLAIKITRLSAVETTGITLFAFIIFSLVTLFAVTRMNDSLWNRVFAIAMNLVTALMATLYLRLLFGDKVFFRNLYYTLNRQTQVYEPLSLAGKISASIPIAVVILGMAVYYLAALAILVVSLTAGRKKQNRENAGE